MVITYERVFLEGISVMCIMKKKGVIKMDIRVLRYFLTVAREGSITAAANFLHVTQPTLSKQLKKLEEELGKKLFVRSNHNVQLTHEGCLLRKRAEDIVDMFDKTTAEFRTMDDLAISGDIYIGAAETSVMTYFAKVAKDIQSRCHNIYYHLYSGNSDDVTERLDRGLIDLGVVVEPVDVSKYNYIMLPYKNIWGVIMRKDSSLASKDTIKVNDLLNVPLICSRQVIKQSLSKNEVSDWFGEEFDKLHIVTTFNLIFNAAMMVKEGFGYAIGFDDLVDTGIESELCFRPLEPQLESGIYIIWKKSQVFSQPAELFLEEIQERYYNNKN